MRLMQEEEFRPLRDGQSPVAGMQAGAPQRGFIEPVEMVKYNEALGGDIIFEVFHAVLQARQKSRIAVGHVSFKGRLVLLFHLVHTVQEYRLVRREMRQLLKYAPLIGIYPLP